MTEKIKIKFLSAYKELFSETWRNIVYYGGRYSGKSYHIGLALLLRGRNKRLRILCTREIQNTIKDSVHKLLKDLCYQYEFNDYAITDDTITNTVTGTEFIFKGLKRNITEIKSMEGIDICWVEEGQNITDESLDILTPTIRKEGSQIIVSFNRFTDLDPIYVRYILKKPEKTFAKHINYDVLERAGLMTEAIRLEMEADKKDNPDLFAHKWLGEPVNQNEMSAIQRAAILSAMNRVADDLGQIEIGVDVARMGEDRTVLWKRKGIKTVDFKIYSHLRIPDICDKIEDFANFDKTIKIKVDDSGLGGGVTDELMKRKYRVIPINFGAEPQDKNKYPNLISEAWFYLKSIINEIQLPNDKDLLMELSTRQWRQDSRGRRCIESKVDYKKRGYRSPDLADACIICYYNDKSLDASSFKALIGEIKTVKNDDEFSTSNMLD